MSFSASPESITMLAGVILSLIFSYTPKVGTWYNTLDGEWKRLVMLGVLLSATGAVFGLACAGIIAGVSCNQAGLIEIAKAFLWSLIANQATDRISPAIGEKRQSGVAVELSQL